MPMTACQVECCLTIDILKIYVLVQFIIPLNFVAISTILTELLSLQYYCVMTLRHRYVIEIFIFDLLKLFALVRSTILQNFA